MKNKVICIVGATASGKTKLSIELAKKINAEIISADSMQIYKDLDVGTAKVTQKEMQGITHHMIDICDIKDKFSVADFKDMCYHEIDKILKKGKNVIIVGGTGLYFNAIVYDMQFKNEAVDTDYREFLIKKANDDGSDSLYKELQKIDPKSALNIHPHNVKQVIRALEIAKNSKNLKSEHMLSEKERLRCFSHPKYEFFVYFIDYPREELYDRINKRINIMVQDGILDEAKMIYDMKLEEDNTCMQAIGYKEFFDYFEGKISLDEAIDNLKKATRHYAKRQITWFNNKLQCKYLKEYKDINSMIKEIIQDSKIL